MSLLKLIASARFPTLVLILVVCPAFCRLAAQTPAAAPASPASAPPAAAPAPPAPTPEQLAIQAATEKDHQRMMDLLGIKELRRGADGDTKSPYAANYDESKADVYPNLPDPLALKNGMRVATAEEWWSKRRPEIVEDFDREIYGRIPANLPKVTWEVVSTTQEKNGDVAVITKRLLGHVDNSIDPAIKVDIDLTLTTPANATGPVPVIMEFGFSREFMAAMAKRFPQFAAMAAGQGPTWQQQVLAKGWGYAELVPTSYQADNGAGLTEGIIGLMNKGQPRKPDDWGALRAWAWGASRALDYFETDKSVDAKQVGLEGHSRYGKATIVTMAYEPRLAIAYVSSSGEGGAKLYRHIFGEQVGNVAGTQEYHWMAGNFLKYAGPLTPGDMPVDAHELIALCAPRPVFISGGATQGDGWVDAKGMFLAAAGAGPVYRLLGKKDMGTIVFPPIETPLIDGDVAFRQHTGGHTPGPNWPTFLAFAGRYLHGPAVAAAAPAPPALTPDQLAIQDGSAKDHQRMMDLLGIKELRRAVDNDPKSPHSANFDETKADRYPGLPDPLVLKDGQRVTTAKVWWTKRRPEIVEDFDREIYGRTPANLPKVTWEVVSTTQEKNGDFSVITKKLLGHVDNSSYPAVKIDIDLTLSTPANATGPVPVIMEFGLSKEILAMFAKRFPQFAASAGAGPTWQQQALAKGWGYAELIPVSYQPDSGAGFTQGIIGLVNKGQPRKPDDWGVLKAWAWGASRALDYFETDKAVDAKQVGLEGHSRYGKATLVAMAYDPRLAIAFVSSSGESGAKLYRHEFGEEESNQAGPPAYHWVAGNFLKYAGPLTPADLPVDQHELIALCAPRPVFISGGVATSEGDGWVDPKGMFLAAAAAGPVYRLLGKKDMGTTVFPPIETPLIDGDVAFRQHSGGHTPGPNWPTFLAFAGRYLHAPPVTPSAPVHLTAEQDRQRMMDLLGIKELRPGEEKDANWDEAKANVYPKLPDPLVEKNGKLVSTADEWWKVRRPEIVEDYDREILGRTPANLPKVSWEVVSTTNETMGGVQVVTKRLAGHVDNSSYPQIAVTIDATLTTPAHAAGPVPVVMALAFAGEYKASLARPISDTSSGALGDYGQAWEREVLAKGWGFAVLSPMSFQADDGAGLTEGIIGLVNKGQPRKLEDWGGLKAWAWGASRLLDYLETDKSVDVSHVGIEGHSRMGKAALVAMAYDPRFAVLYCSSSGEGGAKLYRHIYGEPLSHIESTFYYWMGGNLMKYAGPLTPGDLPVDNHELIALCAPRPVFVGAGLTTMNEPGKPGDGWADARGEFLAEVAAGPVYRLLGKTGLETAEFPPLGTALIQGDLGFRQHQFGHTSAPNWPTFLDFAGRYLH